ncbi:MAG TPA: C40 family peptidase [Caldimonas sp.]|nr:C40 family peptidase [Caldimonas sp.]
MRIHPPALRHGLVGLAAALVLCLAAAPAAASPDEASDPVLQLLTEKGLLGELSSSTASAAPAEASGAAKTGLLRQVRDRASGLTLAALDLVGIRYRRGGTSSETGFDCSGFTRHVFETSLGLVLPRRADEQATAPGLVAVDRDDLRPGDLVFFNTLKRTFSHVGIYIGDNRFIHSPRPGKSVRTEDMSFAYWAKRFTGARRIDATAAVGAPPSAVAIGGD